jgi:hypothetical protein
MGCFVPARLKRNDNEDPLERHILRAVIEDRLGAWPKDHVWNGKPGKLIVTRASSLLSALEELRVQDLPETASALNRRVTNSLYTDFTVLDECSVPAIPALRRTSSNRSLGIFIPAVTMAEISRYDEQDSYRGFVLKPIEGSMFTDHQFLESSDECYFLWDYRPGWPDDLETKLIRDLKLPPGARSRSKAKAIQRAAVALSTAIPEPLEATGNICAAAPFEDTESSRPRCPDDPAPPLGNTGLGHSRTPSGWARQRSPPKRYLSFGPCYKSRRDHPW